MPKPLHSTIPEIETEALIKVMRAFNVRHLPGEKAYSIRFVGSPFNSFVEDCRSILVYTHSRGSSYLSPLNVKSILNKFEIQESDFLEELNKLNQSPSLQFPEEFDTLGLETKDNLVQ